MAHIGGVAKPTSSKTKVERPVARVNPDDERMIESDERFKLNATESGRFVEALLEPTRKVPKAVKDAFEDYRSTVTEA